MSKLAKYIRDLEERRDHATKVGNEIRAIRYNDLYTVAKEIGDLAKEEYAELSYRELAVIYYALDELGDKTRSIFEDGEVIVAKELKEKVKAIGNRLEEA